MESTPGGDAVVRSQRPASCGIGRHLSDYLLLEDALQDASGYFLPSWRNPTELSAGIIMTMRKIIPCCSTSTLMCTQP